jgi:hypothetical protein
MSEEGDTLRVPLRAIAHGRSGDKGNLSNISVIAYSPDFYPILREQLTAERVAQRFAGVALGKVDRYEIPKLGALNFVLHEALGGGVSRNLCLDNYGKSYSAAMLGIEVEVPKRLSNQLRGPGSP